MRYTIFMICLVVGVTQSIAKAEGIELRRATRLPELAMDAAKGFSVRRLELESGRYYRLVVSSDGLEEYRVVAPELFAASWIEQVVVADLETHPIGIRALEFDDEGAMELWFVPVVAGRYRLWVEGLAAEGFEAEVIVR